MWKDAIAIPIPKERPAIVTKLRPISLTSQFAKVCEGFVTNWIMEDMGSKIDRYQYGSLPGSSTSHCLIESLNVFYEELDKPGRVGNLVVTDFSKAFDCIDHTNLVTKLIKLGVRSDLIPWISDFLTNRRQRVKYRNALSSWETVTCGVPQGTKLGPVCFLGTINDASLNSNSHHWKYVDDLSLGETRVSHEPAQIGNDVTELVDWAEENHLHLNPKKCKQMQFCFMRDPPDYPVISINDSPLEVVDVTKILGVWVQNDLKWDRQVGEMISKSRQRLHLLGRLKKFGMSRDDMLAVYMSYVRPVIEYAAPVWHPGLTANNRAAIESIQKRATRIVLGSDYTDYPNALQFLDMESAYERRNHLCNQFAVTCQKSDRYAVWFEENDAGTNMRLRSQRKYLEPRCKTNRRFNSPIPYLTRCLNK